MKGPAVTYAVAGCLWVNCSTRIIWNNLIYRRQAIEERGCLDGEIWFSLGPFVIWLRLSLLILLAYDGSGVIRQGEPKTHHKIGQMQGNWWFRTFITEIFAIRQLTFWPSSSLLFAPFYSGLEQHVPQLFGPWVRHVYRSWDRLTLWIIHDQNSAHGTSWQVASLNYYSRTSTSWRAKMFLRTGNLSCCMFSKFKRVGWKGITWGQRVNWYFFK